MTVAPIVISGFGVISAGGADADQFLQTLLSGTTSISPLTTRGFEHFSTAIGGKVDTALLDRKFTELGIDGDFDRPTRMAMVAIAEAIERSGVKLDLMDRSRVGLVVGKCQTDPTHGDETRPMHGLIDDVGNAFGIFGPRVMVATACAAGTNSIGVARDKLAAGEVDLVFAGGAEALAATTFGGFFAMKALSETPCAPYSVSGGLNLGEGAGFLVLERGPDVAARSGVSIAEVLGYGLSADAYHATAPDPTGRGAAAAVRRALNNAGLDATEVDYVNGHGTGTPANDRMERKVMEAVFQGRRVPISSTKSMVGHTLGAAGAVEAIACTLALQHGFLPPTANAPESDRDDGMDIVPNRARKSAPKAVVSNSYAFGGNNASIVFAAPKAFEPPKVEARRVGITGVGICGPLGIGVEAWKQALSDGTPGFTTFRVNPDDAPITIGAMPDLTARSWSAAKDWRHMDQITRQALAAARLAFEDAALDLGRSERAETGLFMGTAFGPAAVGLAINQEDARHISPIAFSQVTLNAPAGKLCEVMGLRGPTSTITTGAISGTVAFASAVDLVRTGAAPACVVIATDEMFPAWHRRATRHGLLLDAGETPRPYDDAAHGEHIGSTSVAVLVEAVDAAAERGARTYASVEAIRHGSTDQDLGSKSWRVAASRQAEVIEASLRAADVHPKSVGLCLGWASGTAADRIEAAAIEAALPGSVEVVTPKELTGNCMAASGLMNIAIGALSVDNGGKALGPCRRLIDVAAHAVPTEHRQRGSSVSAVALDADRGGSFTSAVLSEVTA